MDPALVKMTDIPEEEAERQLAEVRAKGAAAVEEAVQAVRAKAAT